MIGGAWMLAVVTIGEVILLDCWASTQRRSCCNLVAPHKMKKRSAKISKIQRTDGRISTSKIVRAGARFDFFIVNASHKPSQKRARKSARVRTAVIALITKPTPPVRNCFKSSDDKPEIRRAPTGTNSRAVKINTGQRKA